MKRVLVATTATAVVLALAGCSSAANDSAQTAYDACVKPDAEAQLLEVDGDTVSIVVAGEDAQAMAGTDDEIDTLASSELDGPSGIGVTFAVVINAECLVEETGYPGSFEQLTHGDEWEGWKFEEDSGAGSEMSLHFIATS